MGNRSITELLRDVQAKTEATSKAATKAKDLITPALKPALEKTITLEEIHAMDKSMEEAQAFYLASVSVYHEYQEALELLGKNKEFMSKPQNKEGFQKFVSFRKTNSKFLEQVKSSLDQLELWLIALKKQAGVEMPELNEPAAKMEFEESKVETKIQKKCNPGCTIL